MSTGIYSIGITGMQAAQLGLMTTEHNIANVNTAGYNRQRTVQTTNTPIMTGAGAIGQGTRVSTVERMYSQFLGAQVNSSEASVNELQTFYAEISQIDNMLADSSSGLSPALQDFFKGVQQVAANPSLLPARQTMVSSAEALVNRFRSIEGRLSEIDEGVNSQIFSTVSEINSYAQQIASLNERVALAQASSNQTPNDLLDQRDQLVSELNKLVKVNTTTNSDGSYNVYIGTGQQLVIGSQVTTMTATGSQADRTRIVVGLQVGGRVQELPENLVTGGKLGGLVRFRSESLDPAYNEFGRVAASLALTFNAQHGLGQDLLGQSSGVSGFVADFFNMANMQPSVIGNAGNTGSGVVQAGFLYSNPGTLGSYDLSYDGTTYTLSSKQFAGQTWTGNSLNALLDGNGNPFPSSAGINFTGVVLSPGGQTTLYSPTSGSTFSTDLTASDYRVKFGAGGSYTITRLSDNKDVATGTGTGSVSLDGLAITIGAVGANGDSFLIQPTRNAARNIAVDASVAADPRLIAAGSPFRTGASTGNTGTGSISTGQSVFGYTSTSLPATGLTLTYDAGPPNTLSGFPSSANISVTLSNGTTQVYSGSGPVPFAAGAKYSFDGVSFEMSGKPNDGDSFTVARNTDGSADARNAVLLGKLQTQGTMAGGTTNYQAAFAKLVSNVGNKTREVEVKAEAQAALLEQAKNTKEAMSGVNLDEEAANLLRYQQAYQAAAKMLDIAGKIFDTVLSLRT